MQTETYVIAVESEMVISRNDPSEPCLKFETVALLRVVKEHAERQDLE